MEIDEWDRTCGGQRRTTMMGVGWLTAVPGLSPSLARLSATRVGVGWRLRGIAGKRHFRPEFGYAVIPNSNFIGSMTASRWDGHGDQAGRLPSTCSLLLPRQRYIPTSLRWTYYCTCPSQLGSPISLLERSLGFDLQDVRKMKGQYNNVIRKLHMEAMYSEPLKPLSRGALDPNPDVGSVTSATAHRAVSIH